MKRLFVLLAMGLLAATGCGSSPPPKGDPVEYDRQMRDLNEEILRQEGKLKPRR